MEPRRTEAKLRLIGFKTKLSVLHVEDNPNSIQNLARKEVTQMAAKPKTRTVVRDSRDGRFVPKREATRRPASTETERVRVPTQKKK